MKDCLMLIFFGVRSKSSFRTSSCYQASVEKSIIKKKGKVPGRSGMTEILKASSDVRSKMIADLANSQTLLLTYDSL